jgi:hypothetical protein
MKTLDARSFVAISLLLLLSAGMAQSTYNERKPLRGLKHVRVLVEGLPPDAKGILTKEQLQTDVELRLRKAGIRVSDDRQSPDLYLNVGVLKATEHEWYVYSIRLDFEEAVTLERDKSIWVIAETWSTPANLGLAGSEVISDAVRQKVGDEVDAFVNDYLAENPK